MERRRAPRAAAPAATATAIAPKPIKPAGEELEPLVPPRPVAGAPSGMMDTVVVVTGTVVVVVPTVVVVVTAVVVVLVVDVVVDPAVVVVVGATAEHRDASIVLASSVTPPVWARTRPCTVALLRSVTEVEAMIVPLKFVVVPNVADDPTCQNTSQGVTPPDSTTELADAVINVETAWKMKVEPAGPVRVSCPVSPSDDALL